MRFAPAASVAPSRIRAIADIAEVYPAILRLFHGEDTLVQALDRFESAWNAGVLD